MKLKLRNNTKLVLDSFSQYFLCINKTTNHTFYMTYILVLRIFPEVFCLPQFSSKSKENEWDTARTSAGNCWQQGVPRRRGEYLEIPRGPVAMRNCSCGRALPACDLAGTTLQAAVGRSCFALPLGAIHGLTLSFSLSLEMDEIMAFSRTRLCTVPDFAQRIGIEAERVSTGAGWRFKTHHWPIADWRTAGP